MVCWHTACAGLPLSLSIAFLRGCNVGLICLYQTDRIMLPAHPRISMRSASRARLQPSLPCNLSRTPEASCLRRSLLVMYFYKNRCSTNNQDAFEQAIVKRH
jgi:hypothetical protein